MKFHAFWTEHVGPHDTWVHRMKPDLEGDAPTCPVCGTYAGAIEWLPPFRATLIASFGKLGDLTSRRCNSYLVSERFRQAWEERKLQGIAEFTPLERLRVRPARLAKPGLTYYVITPPRGPRVDFARSHIEYEGIMTCNYCQSVPGEKTVRGFTIEPASWNGEDMFRPWGMTGTLVVTDRVRQLRDDYDLKNVELTPVEEYVFPRDHGVDEEN